MLEPRTSAPGAKEVGDWQNQIVRSGAVVNGNTTSAVPVAMTNPAAVTLYNMDRAARQQIALLLKNAGYRVPTSGVFSDSLLTSYNDAIGKAQYQAQQLGQPFDKKFFEAYMAREIEGSAGGTGGPSTTIQTNISTPDQVKALVDAVMRDQAGRAASAAEVKKYTKMVQEKQRRNPTVTTITSSGSGQSAVSTTGGFNAQQYLIDQVAGTDEAKANKVLGYYETFMNALGRD